jgi:hypothetical protein
MLRTRKKVLVKTVLWVVTEVMLNLLNLDTLADYSEFLFETEGTLLTTYHPNVTLVIPACDRPSLYLQLLSPSLKTSHYPVQ